MVAVKRFHAESLQSDTNLKLICGEVEVMILAQHR